jgi:aminopeptidase N
MKKLLFIPFVMGLIFFFFRGQGQVSPPTTFSTIIETEQKMHERSLELQAANSLVLTLASNNFDVTHYRCEWNINPAVRYISGKVTSSFLVTQSTNSITFDLSDTLRVDSIVYHGGAIGFQRKPGDALEIQFPAILNNGIKDSVTIYYKGVPRPAGFGAFTQTTHSGVPIIWTLSEPYGSKEWWPCKNGLTDKADSIDIIVTCPIEYRSSSNGVIIKEDIGTGSRILHFSHRYPIASYLVAVAVTNYAVVKDSVMIGNKQMPLILTTYPEWLGNAAKINTNAKKSFELLNNAFGEYPFAREQYTQTAWSRGGGMEHQTNSFIATTEEELIVHELAHQWFGDMITCGSWQNIWLNEGFATYSWLLYLEKYYPQALVPYLDYFGSSITAKTDGSVFVYDTTSISRIFSGIYTYRKGAYVAHMLRWVVGDTIFYKGMREYLNDPKLKNKFATTEDLRRNMEKASGKNLQSFFQNWIYGEGYPNYKATWTTNNNNWVKVKLNQSTSHPSVKFYDMPVPLQFKNAGRDTIIVVHHQFDGEEFWVNPGFKPDSLFIDPKLQVLAKEKTVIKSTPLSNKTNEIKIFPNPASDNINISIYNPTIPVVNLLLYNAAGQILYQSQIKMVGRDEKIIIPSTQFAKGVYFLRLYAGKDFNKTIKVVK